MYSTLFRCLFVTKCPLKYGELDCHWKGVGEFVPKYIGSFSTNVHFFRSVGLKLFTIALTWPTDYCTYVGFLFLRRQISEMVQIGEYLNFLAKLLAFWELGQIKKGLLHSSTINSTFLRSVVMLSEKLWVNFSESICVCSGYIHYILCGNW